MNELDKIADQMMDKLYKKSFPKITWKQFQKKYKGTGIKGYEKHWTTQKESEEILDKYKKKVRLKKYKDALAMLWLDLGPISPPNPGSKEAQLNGCTCAVLDNHYGADWFNKVHGFYITKGCPLHWSEKHEQQ